MNIPAIRGKIGNTIYYSANFTFQQINDLVKKVEGEIYTSAPLKERIQRSLYWLYMMANLSGQRYVLS